MQERRNKKSSSALSAAFEAMGLNTFGDANSDGVEFDTASEASTAAIALGSRLIGCPIVFAREGERFPPIVTSGRRFVSFVDDTAITDASGRKIGTLRTVALGDRPALKEAERAIVREVASILTAEHEAGLAVSHYDDETLLPNRRAFLSEIETRPELATGDRQLLALFTVTGLQQYSEITHALGHSFAEAFAQSAARRIQQLLGPDIRIYNVNTLSFAFLCSASKPLVSSSFADILEAFRNPVVHRGMSVFVDASIGYTELTRPVLAEEALRTAQLAAQAARETGSRVVFRPTPTASTDQRAQSILTDLNIALASRDQLQLVYQPRVGFSSGKIVAVEALIRWEHPKHGHISPGDFIPLAEATALMSPLTQWVIETALHEMALWRERGLDISLSVNVSAANLRRADFGDKLFELARARNIPPRLLEVEVTENTAARAESAILDQLNRCRDAGFTISIDDFGTGHSNLRHLMGLPASVLKIDRSLIEDMLHDSRTQILVRSTLELAQNLGYSTVAEGIETEAAYRMLRDWGCDAGQGYYIAYPMPADELVRWMKEHP